MTVMVHNHHLAQVIRHIKIMKNKIIKLILAQWIVVLIYSKFGYKCDDPSSAYAWGVFFHVSNQLIMILWCTFIPVKSYRLTAIIFNSLLAITWANWYLPPIKYVVENYGLFKTILTYVVICLSVQLYFDSKK